MKLELIERILKSGNKVNVLNYPVGIEIFLLNPFRICNISPDGDWNNMGKNLKTSFNRFLSLSKINKMEKEPIGPGKDFLFNNYLMEEYRKINANIDKPHAKLAWKIFWMNSLADKYDQLPRQMEKIDLAEFSDHSKAIVYHSLAINNTIPVLNNPSANIQTQYWEKALEFWALTFENENFWNEIKEIVDQEEKKGHFEFRGYSIEKIKKEIANAIYSSMLFFPLKLNEQDFSEDKNKEKSRSNCFSKFLNILLTSKLGSESLRLEFAKQLVENRIGKESSSVLKKVEFKKWCSEGKYRKLFDTSMRYIDKIHNTTEIIKEESHDKNLHASTFLEDIHEIPEIHSRAVNIIIEGILVDADNDLDREVKDRMYITQLILGLRILSELKVDTNTRLRIIKTIEVLLSRFSYGKMSQKEKASLNSNILAQTELVNHEIVKKYYMAQYCYFIDGEYADPDASLYKTEKVQNGNLITTNYTFIPRSKVAKKFHDGSLKASDVGKNLRTQRSKDDVRIRLEEIKSGIAEKIVEKEKFEKINRNYISEYKKIQKIFNHKRSQLELNIAKKYEELKKSDEFVLRFRAIGIEISKLRKKKEAIDKKEGSLESIEKKRKLQMRLGLALLVIAFPAFIVLMVLFSFLVVGVGVALVLSISGVVFIDQAEKSKKRKIALKRKHNILDSHISNKKSSQLKPLQNRVREKAKSHFRKHFIDLKKLKGEALNWINKHKKVKNKIRDLGSAITNLKSKYKTLLKPIQYKYKALKANGNHPVLKHYSS